MRTVLIATLIAVLVTSCGTSKTSDATAIATAVVGNPDGTTATLTATPSAANDATPPPATPVVHDPAQPDGVSQAFFDSYKSDPSGDTSATFFTQGMTALYNSGKTVAAITGIDPTYTTATITNTQLYNDNKNAVVTVQLDYANGSQKVDVTLELQHNQWRVAAIAGQPQK